jgi:hypothetical protein
MTGQFALLALACALPGLAAHASADAARSLVEIKAPQHDPLFLDAATLKRNGSTVSFKYLLDVLSPPDEDAKPRQWRSNEIEASIDCRNRTVVVRRLVAYSGPCGTGVATAVHSFMSPGVKPEPIEPKSTFAYLESHVCRGV